jgi:hypothetical protein
MSGGLTGAAAIAALNYLTGTALSLGTTTQTMQLALLTAAPPSNPSTTQITEVTSVGYARQTVTWALATDPTAGQPSTISNSNTILYGPFTATIGLQYPATYAALIGTSIPSNTTLLSTNAGDIETDATAWSAALNATVAQSTAQAHSGTHSLLVTATASGDTQAALATGVAINPGTTYQGSAWCYAPASGITVKVELWWYDAGANFISASSASATVAAGSTWAQYTVSGVAPSNAATAKLVLRPQATGSSQLFYFDTMALIATLQPTVLAWWQFDQPGQAAQNQSLQINPGSLVLNLG